MVEKPEESAKRGVMTDEKGQPITDVWRAYDIGYENGESSVEFDWKFAIEDVFDIDVDGPWDACKKLKELMARQLGA